MRLSYKKIISVAEQWLSFGGQAKVEVAALEPLLWKEHNLNISDVIDILKKLGYVVSITSNGSLLEHYAESLKKSNIDLIRLSWHSMNPTDYKEITGGGNLYQFINGLEKAIKLDINISLNRVLLSGLVDDVKEQLDFVDNHSMRLKLLDLYWTPSNADFFEKYYISPEEVIDSLKIENGFLKPMKSTLLDTRQRVQFTTPNNGKLEYKLSSTANKTHSICKICDKKNECLEGYADYFRVFPEGIASFCYLKKELGKNIFDKENAILSKFLENSNLDEENFKAIISRIPLRLVLEGRCNFNCGFPQSNYSWCLKYDKGYKFPVRRYFS